MHNVKSKYKNPDKYIERLKKGIKWYGIQNKNLFDYEKHRLGKNVLHWSADVKGSVSCTGISMKAFSPGDRIIQIGEVYKVVVERKRSEVFYDSKEIKIRYA